MASGAGSTVGQTRIVVDGTEMPNSIRQTECSTIMVLGLIGGNSAGEGGSNLIMPVSLSAGNVINLQLRRLDGSGSVNLRTRTLNIIKVG